MSYYDNGCTKKLQLSLTETTEFYENGAIKCKKNDNESIDFDEKSRVTKYSTKKCELMVSYGTPYHINTPIYNRIVCQVQRKYSDIGI